MPVCWILWFQRLMILMALAITRANLYPVFTVCPIPMPCHCTDKDMVVCSFKRLTAIPYLFEFDLLWKELDMSENFIEHLPSIGFKGIKVTTLNLRRNAIRNIEVDAFEQIKQLEILDMSHNYLRHIKKGVLAPLKTMRSLILKYNILHRVNDDAFVGVTHLRELDLSGNELTRVPSNALEPLSGLKKLILRDNKIKIIHDSAFSNLRLEYIDLGDNVAPLDIQNDAFCGLEPRVVHTGKDVIEWSGLSTLRLDHNGITSLNPCIAKAVWTLATIDISGNPIECDCRLFMFRDSGTKTDFPDGQCATPKVYAGQLINKIPPSAYTCHWNSSSPSCVSSCLNAPAALSNEAPSIDISIYELFVSMLLMLLSC